MLASDEAASLWWRRVYFALLAALGLLPLAVAYC